MDGPPVRIFLVGNVALERGDVLVPESRLPGRQGRLAFTLLTIERADALSTDRFSDVLWDGARPSSWGTALRAIVSKLRLVLAATGTTGTIEHTFGRYRLRLPPDTWIDIEAASSSVHDAEIALRDGDLATANGAALVANAIARRPFMEGVDRPWVDRQRAVLRDIQARALSCRAEVALAAGDHRGAAADAERIIALEPLREQAYVMLMRAHVNAGNHAEALATYERLRTTLVSKLGANPSPASEAAFVDLLRAT
jgi:DNA-binding SARP family transcriptional activator